MESVLGFVVLLGGLHAYPFKPAGRKARWLIRDVFQLDNLPCNAGSYLSLGRLYPSLDLVPTLDISLGDHGGPEL